MADCVWVGKATATAQITTATPANVAAADTFTLTAWSQDGIKSVDIAFVSVAGTVQEVVEALTAQWNASTHPLCTGVTASEDNLKVTLTADTAGVPFTVTGAAVEGGGAPAPTLTVATTTANSGPNCWDLADNWTTPGTVDPGTVPTDGDTVYLKDSSVDILYGLDQDTVELTALYRYQSFTGKIGTFGPLDGASLRIDATTVYLGVDDGDGVGSATGPSRELYDFPDVAATINVYNTAAGSEESTLPPCRIKTGANANVLNLYRGSVGLAVNDANDTAQFTTINMSFVSDKENDANLVVGKGVTLTTINKTGGSATLHNTAAAITTFNNQDGYCYHDGAAITNAMVAGGHVVFCGTGTITNLDASGGLTECYNVVSAADEVTNVYLYGSATVKSDRMLTARTFTNHIYNYKGGNWTLFIDNDSITSGGGANLGMTLGADAVTTPVVSLTASAA